MNHMQQRMHDFADAARAVVEGDLADLAAGRPSRTIFLSMRVRGSDVEAATMDCAARQGIGVVALEFGRGGTSGGPRAYTVGLPEGSGRMRIHHDCALAELADGTCVLVPRGPGAPDAHFAIGAAGLELRAGRPPSLGAGMVRAARRLNEASRRPRAGVTRITITDAVMAA